MKSYLLTTFALMALAALLTLAGSYVASFRQHRIRRALSSYTDDERGRQQLDAAIEAGSQQPFWSESDEG